MIYKLLPLLLIVCSNVYANKTEDFLKTIQKGRTLQGFFSQGVTDQTGAIYPLTSGEFFVKRPGKFFWRYYGEDGQKIVSTGSRVWVEQPDLANAAHASLKSVIESSPIVILLAPKDIKKYFKIQPIHTKDNFSWVKLIPLNKDDMNFETLLVAIKNNNIKQIKITDSLDRTVTVKFINIKYNLPISDKIFDYKPPSKHFY